MGQFLEPRLFQVRETLLLKIEGTTKGPFRSVAEKGRGLDPQDSSPNCAPESHCMSVELLK